jgi:hypothetical protein
MNLLAAFSRSEHTWERQLSGDDGCDPTLAILQFDFRVRDHLNGQERPAQNRVVKLS